MTRSLFKMWITAVFIMTASVCLGHGSVHERIEALTVRIADEPHDADLFFRRGRLWLLDEQPSRAVHDLEQSLMIDPEHNEALLLKAGAYLRMQEYGHAASNARNYIKEHGERADAYIILARSQFNSGDTSVAVESYTKAFGLIAHVSPDLYLEQARAAASSGDEGMYEAIRLLEQAMAKLGRIVSLESVALDYELQLKENEAALKRVERLIHSPGHTDHWKRKKSEVQQRAIQP